MSFLTIVQNALQVYENFQADEENGATPLSHKYIPELKKQIATLGKEPNPEAINQFNSFVEKELERLGKETHNYDNDYYLYSLIPLYRILSLASNAQSVVSDALRLGFLDFIEEYTLKFTDESQSFCDIYLKDMKEGDDDDLAYVEFWNAVNQLHNDCNDLASAQIKSSAQTQVSEQFKQIQSPTSMRTEVHRLSMSIKTDHEKAAAAKKKGIEDIESAKDVKGTIKALHTLSKVSCGQGNVARLRALFDMSQANPNAPATAGTQTNASLFATKTQTIPPEKKKPEKKLKRDNTPYDVITAINAIIAENGIEFYNSLWKHYTDAVDIFVRVKTALKEYEKVCKSDSDMLLLLATEMIKMFDLLFSKAGRTAALEMLNLYSEDFFLGIHELAKSYADEALIQTKNALTKYELLSPPINSTNTQSTRRMSMLVEGNAAKNREANQYRVGLAMQLSRAFEFVTKNFLREIFEKLGELSVACFADASKKLEKTFQPAPKKKAVQSTYAPKTK